MLVTQLAVYEPFPVLLLGHYFLRQVEDVLGVRSRSMVVKKSFA